MLANIAAIIAPLFVCAGVGFLWGRFERPFDPQVITGLALNLGMPCLIFSTLTKLEISLEAFAEMAGIYSIAVVCFLGFGALLVTLLKMDMRAFLPSLSFSNTGNMGLPITLFAFGEAGLSLSISVFVIASVAGLIIGGAISSGRTSFDLVYKNPLFYGIGAAAIFMFAGVRPPAWIANTTDIVGGMAIPLMLISLGVAMSRLRVERFPRSLALSVMKLIFGFAIGCAIASVFGLTGIARGVFIVQCSMPVAVHNYLFAQRFDREPSEVAGMVLISTAISFVTLPLLLIFVL